MSRHTRVVSLWLHPGREEAFDAFERQAARLMARHGGRIDQAVRVAAGNEQDAPYEVHFVSFPSEADASAYAADPDVVALRPERDSIIARTTILTGQPASPYPP